MIPITGADEALREARMADTKAEEGNNHLGRVVGDDGTSVPVMTTFR
jgi:hypothetical protein